MCEQNNKYYHYTGLLESDLLTSFELNLVKDELRIFSFSTDIRTKTFLQYLIQDGENDYELCDFVMNYFGMNYEMHFDVDIANKEVYNVINIPIPIVKKYDLKQCKVHYATCFTFRILNPIKLR